MTENEFGGAVRERTLNTDPLRSLRSLREALVRKALGNPAELEQARDDEPAAG